MSSNNRFAVYTVMVGDYDYIRQPLVVDGRFDFLLFTDTSVSGSYIKRSPHGRTCPKQYLTEKELIG